MDGEEYDFDYERSRALRMLVYRCGVYAKHVGSNAYSGYRPFPPRRRGQDHYRSSRQVEVMPSRIRMWLAREVSCVSPNADSRLIESFFCGLLTR